MGGFIGQRIAARHPDLLRSLTLLDTSAEPEVPAAARQDKLLALIFRFAGMAPVRRPAMKIMFGPTFLAGPKSKAVVDEWTERVSRCDRAATRQAVLGVANRKGVAGEIGKITAPTLVIVGEHDQPTPPDRSRQIAAAIPGARLEIVAECGHSSTVEQPEAVTALIRAFVTEVDAQTG
jgi:pimeloyl-ACP methyl ester carboxylesterase